MLFVITHEHDGSECPVDDPASPVKRVSSEKHAQTTGVRVVGRYISPPEHTLYFIIEADNYDKVIEFFRPMMHLGVHRINPVVPLGEAIELLKAS